MPVFAISWKRVFEEDSMCDRETVVEKGILRVVAETLNNVEEEIEKLKGCETNRSESVVVTSIELTEEEDTNSLLDLRRLLDPWNIRELRASI